MERTSPASSERTLPEAFAEATRAWPNVSLDESELGAELRTRANAAGARPEELHASDVFLAAGCAKGDRAALQHFEAVLIPEAGRALSRLRLPLAEVEELLSRIREKLLVRAEGEPLIATYSGKGSLIGFVRAVAVREALSEKRKLGRRGTPVSETGLADLAARDEPELTRMRALYAEPFKAAFRDALSGLPPRDRNVLRMVYVDGLTAEQVGLAYGVHRVSVARWIGGIRATLFERTRDTLAERLRVSHGELLSLTRMCLSQVDVSIERLLEE